MKKESTETKPQRAARLLKREVDDLKRLWGGGWGMLTEDHRRALVAQAAIGMIAGLDAPTAEWCIALAEAAIAADVKR